MNKPDWVRRALLFGAVAAPVSAAPVAGASSKGAFTRPPLFVIEEYHLVLEGQRSRVIDYYRSRVLPVLRSYPGYMGWSVLDPKPPATAFRSAAVAAAVGIPAEPIQPHEGVVLDGVVRTDRQLVFHTSLNGAFNLIFQHHITDEETFLALIGHTEAGAAISNSLSNRWMEFYGTDIWEEMARDYFIHMKNHYDVVYSFTSSE